MTDAVTYSRDRIFDLIKHDALVSLYNNPALKEKSDEISKTYSYFFGSEIKDVKHVAPLLVVNKEKSESIYTQVHYDLVQSFGMDFFTNADLKTKKQSDVLIHSILCNNDYALDKIKTLKNMSDTPVLVTFKNIDTASSLVIDELNSLFDSNLDNVFMGFEARTITNVLTNIKLLEVENSLSKKMKMK